MTGPIGVKWGRREGHTALITRTILEAVETSIPTHRLVRTDGTADAQPNRWESAAP